MISIDDLLGLKLVKRNTSWNLETTDKVWHFLKETGETFPLNYSREVVKYYIANLDKTIGLQGTNIQSLQVPRTLVAKWISEGEI